jgi:hypothetical protein
MKKLALISILLTLTGCNPPIALTTAPGAHLPTGIALCTSHDSVGRCSSWTGEQPTDTCINPQGIDAKPPTLPCSSIKKEDAHE